MLKSLEYSLRYMLLIVIMYYLFMKGIYTLSFFALAIIPVNFLAIQYGIYSKIEKDHYVTKEYILLSLVFYTTIFNVIFLSINKVSVFIIILTVVINLLELVYLDNVKQKKKK